MPINELETHPYLFNQITDFTDQKQLAKYCKLIVGTFPIYAITTSFPVQPIGLQIRAAWNVVAFIQYFYGSRQNHLWELFSLSFNEPIPNTTLQAIELLNKYKFCMTDVFTESYRKGYSSLDQDLINPVHNTTILDLIQNSVNLKIIYFTSWGAKKHFCMIMHIPCIRIADNVETIFGKFYRMIVLISPAGNGRAAWSFRHTFPLLPIEIDNRTNGIGYALAYRKRYYNHYLNLPCD